MSWVDVFNFILLGVILWGGIFKGVVKEFFEFLIVTLNPLLCSHVYGYLSDLLNAWFGTPNPWAGILSFTFISLIFAVGLWILSGKTEMALNISPSNRLNKFGGALVAAIKGIVILWAVLLTLGQIPMSNGAIQIFKNSATVSMIDNVSGPMDGLFATLGSNRFHAWLRNKIDDSNF